MNTGILVTKPMRCHLVITCEGTPNECSCVTLGPFGRITRMYLLCSLLVPRVACSVIAFLPAPDQYSDCWFRESPLSIPRAVTHNDGGRCCLESLAGLGATITVVHSQELWQQMFFQRGVGPLRWLELGVGYRLGAVLEWMHSCPCSHPQELLPCCIRLQWCRRRWSCG
jgi:hypothetical protein